MGVYSTSAMYGGVGVNTDEIEPQLFDESYDIMEATYQIAIECEQNYNSIMRAIGLQELAAVESTGEEMIYEAGSISGFFSKVKEWFKKLIAKIKGLFARFMAVVNGYIKSDSEFVSKYQKQIYQGWAKVPSSFQIKGYKYTNMEKTDYANITEAAIKAKGNNIKNMIEKHTDDEAKDNAEKQDSDYWDTQLEKFRGNVLNQTTTELSASEFQKEAFMYYRDGESSKIILDKSDIKIADCVDGIKTASKAKSAADKANRGIVKAYNEAIKDLETFEKSLLKVQNKNDRTTNNLTLVSNNINHLRNCSTVASTMHGYHLTAMREQNRQQRAICVKAVQYANGKKATRESATYDYESGSSLLASVELI